MTISIRYEKYGMHNGKRLNVLYFWLARYNNIDRSSLILSTKDHIGHNNRTLYLWFPSQKMISWLRFQSRNVCRDQLGFLFPSDNAVIGIYKLCTFSRIKNDGISLFLRKVEHNTTLGIIDTVTKVHSPCHKYYSIVVTEQKVVIDKLKC